MIVGASCFPFSRSAKPREGALPMPILTESPSRKSWRDILPIHPAAELFPPISPDELKAFGEDILRNGLTSGWAAWTTNPVTGCLHNCPYCYAREGAEVNPNLKQFYPIGFKPL